MKMSAKQNCQNGRSTVAFTLIELLVVIGIIGLVASLVVVGIGQVKYKKWENGTKAQLAKYELAIESYKTAFGSYPPDDPATAAAKPYWNPLAYELGGVRRSGVNFTSESDPTHTITPVMLTSYFNLSGLVNAAPPGPKLKTSINLRSGTGQTADVVFLTNAAPGNPPPVMLLQVPAEHPHPAQTINVWRYRAYPAGGHNPKTFDLWAEIKKKGGGTNIIGNWK
jgi:prepilin-type N-terminal cleavage/methylation domain-containing protein